MSKASLKAARYRRENAVGMGILTDVLAPEVLHKAVPRLAEVEEARVEYRNKMNEIQQWGAVTRSSGWVPGKNMQYVAQIDQSVWSAVLEVFARYDEKGNLMDDGLLYITNQKGQVVLNKDFFYALLDGPLKRWDMRGKIKLT